MGVGDLLTRAASWTRTNMDLLMNSPDGWVAEQQGPVWWQGSDLSQIGPTPEMTALGVDARPAGLPAVGRATQIVVEPIVGTPWQLRRGTPGRPQSATLLDLPRWVSDPQLSRPDWRVGVQVTAAGARMSGVEFWSQMLTSMLWWGRGVLLFLEDEQGAPSAGSLRVLPPQDVRVLGPEDTAGGFTRLRIGSDVLTDRDGYVPVLGPGWRTMLVRGMPPYDGQGRAVGVLARYAQDFALAVKAREFAQGTFTSGVPAGYLKVTGGPPLSQADADRLKQTWMAAHGQSTRRGIAVLNQHTDFSTVAMSPLDAQLVELHRLSLTDVANAFGVPAHMLGGAEGGSNTYGNVNDRRRDLWQFTLAPWAMRLMQGLSALLPVGQFLTVDRVSLLNANPAEQALTVTGLYESGLMSRAESRDALGLPADDTVTDTVTDENQEGNDDE